MTSLLIACLAAAGGELEQALVLLDGLETQRISVRYDDEPLAAVLDDVAARLAAPVRGDWPALERLGVEPDDRVSLRLDDTPGLSVLSALALQLGDEFEHATCEVHAGRLLLTTIQATADMRLLDVYDVRDLLADEAVVERLRTEAPPIGPPAEDDAPAEPAEPGDEPDDDDDPPPASRPDAAAGPDLPAPTVRPLTPGEALLLLISDHVDPESWVNFGGSRALIGERDGVLFVTAAPTTHRRFRDALRRLRRSNPAAVRVEAAVVEIAADELARLARRHDAGSRRLAAAVRRSDGATVLWRAATETAVGARYEAATDTPAGGIELVLAPTLDAGRGLVRLEIGLAVRRGDETRELSTTAAFAPRREAAVIEVPAPAPGERILVLVLSLERR
ncbi:MAG: hypothetical protein ACYTG1_05185 [Planctomycetota bacterium]